MVRTRGSATYGGVRMTTGTYTGDGAATQAIAGVGFTPRHVMIHVNLINAPGYKNDQDGVNAYIKWNGGSAFRYDADMIISLDADGFTVGDGTPGLGNFYNVLNQVYTYICFG